MNTTQWPQELGLMKPMEDVIMPTSNNNNNNNNNNNSQTQMIGRRSIGKATSNHNANPNPKELVLNCPRCHSTDTKFCYYNNYSLTQPRYFCKTCRRYWTEGGSLRNVPVGGGSRKNKKSSSSSVPTTTTTQNPNPNLNFPAFSADQFGGGGGGGGGAQGRVVGPTYVPSPGPMSAMLSMVPLPLPEFAASGIMFPFEELRRVGSSDHGNEGDVAPPPPLPLLPPSGFWSGMMGGNSGGSSW